MGIEERLIRMQGMTIPY